MGSFCQTQVNIKVPKVKLDFKIRLFKAACISILLYGCESWVLTEALMDKLEIFARVCIRLILGIEQFRDYVTNESLYHLTGKAFLRKTILKRENKFTGRMPTEEPANRFVIDKFKIRSYIRPGAPTLNQISSHILPSEKTLEAYENI